MFWTSVSTISCKHLTVLIAIQLNSREVGHRVKAISASKFSGAELLALKQGGNGIALKIWLSNYSTHDAPEPESDDDIRAFMRQKYFENKWLDCTLLQAHKEKVRTLLAKQFTEDGLPIVTKSRTKIVSGFARVPLIADSEMNIIKDDDEDEDLDQDHVVASPSAPVMTIPECNNPITFAIPPLASPTGRASMESNYSSFSAKSSASVHSQPQEDYVGSNRRRVGSSKRSVSSGRDSMDSTCFSTTSSVSSSGANVLTAEEIAERCRSSIESKDFIAQEILPTKEETLPIEEPVLPEAPIKEVEQKVAPSLQINVAQANRDYVQFQKYQHKQHLKVMIKF